MGFGAGFVDGFGPGEGDGHAALAADAGLAEEADLGVGLGEDLIEGTELDFGGFSFDEDGAAVFRVYALIDFHALTKTG